MRQSSNHFSDGKAYNRLDPSSLSNFTDSTSLGCPFTQFYVTTGKKGVRCLGPWPLANGIRRIHHLSWVDWMPSQPVLKVGTRRKCKHYSWALILYYHKMESINALCKHKHCHQWQKKHWREIFYPFHSIRLLISFVITTWNPNVSRPGLDLPPYFDSDSWITDEN